MFQKPCYLKHKQDEQHFESHANTHACILNFIYKFEEEKEKRGNIEQKKKPKI